MALRDNANTRIYQDFVHIRYDNASQIFRGRGEECEILRQHFFDRDNIVRDPVRVLVTSIRGQRQRYPIERISEDSFRCSFFGEP
jgi:hypothetical protein